MKSILHFYILLSSLMVIRLEGDKKVVQKLEDHHLCSKLVSYDEKRVVPMSRLQKHVEKYFCMKIPPVCTRDKIKVVYSNETITVKISKIVYDCCTGYKKENKTCVPVCNLGCNNGMCIEPEICACDPGWKGHNCSEECSNNTYGQDCMNKCICENDGWCEKNTGMCICPDGYTSDHCELECPDGWYGFNCEYACKCQNDAICDFEYGFCYCEPGYYGDYCEQKCEPGFHGYGCVSICVCENDTTEFCDHQDGRCICKPGYRGRFCESECTDMTYGIGCAKDCDCENSKFCEPSNGKCLCDIGWIGDRCTEKCPEGYFGDGCKYKCIACDNDRSACNHITGVCHCIPGYIGNDCELNCPEGFWGLRCENICNCSMNATCDSKTGECDCNAGWTGENCFTPCSSNLWGRNCSNVCSCSDNEMCDAVNGNCSCKAGWNGENCTMHLGVSGNSSQSYSIYPTVVGCLIIISFACGFCYLYRTRHTVCCQRTTSTEELRENEENIGAHFNPLYNNLTETGLNVPGTTSSERSISFVNILSSIGASIKERTSGDQSEPQPEATFKRASKVSNLSARNSLSKLDQERPKPYSISDDLDSDFAPERLHDFNIAENITDEQEKQGSDLNGNK